MSVEVELDLYARIFRDKHHIQDIAPLQFCGFPSLKLSSDVYPSTNHPSMPKLLKDTHRGIA